MNQTALRQTGRRIKLLCVVAATLAFVVLLAACTNNTIEVYWNNEETSTVSLYWAGTFMPPAVGIEEFTWESVNDTEKTGGSIMASSSETKIFTYKDGIISYEVSALGMTMTAKLARAHGA
jgi:hypothetical protein